MPVFSQIELFMDSSYPAEEQREFVIKSRCICNFVERKLAHESVSAKYSRVNIHCSKEDIAATAVPLRGAPFIEVRISYSFPPLDELDEVSLQQHLAQVIEVGLRAAESCMSMPIDVCMSALKSFADGNYKNRWIQSEKSWNRQSIRCEVVAEMTPDKFTLTQNVFRSGRLVKTAQIAESLPREYLFAPFLGRLSMSRDGKVLYRNGRKEISVFNLSTLEFVDQVADSADSSG